MLLICTHMQHVVHSFMYLQPTNAHYHVHVHYLFFFPMFSVSEFVLVILHHQTLLSLIAV